MASKRKTKSGVRVPGSAPWYVALGVGGLLLIPTDPATVVTGLALITYALTGKKA